MDAAKHSPFILPLSNAMSEKQPLPLVEVARFGRLADARERSLALAAKDLAYAIERDGEEWKLCVEENVRDIALAELADVAAEETRKANAPPAPPLEKIPALPLFLFGWFMAACFYLQEKMGPEWMARGEADGEAIVHQGEWWRTITALTLHGDGMHLIVNLATGLLFAAFLLPQFGSGLSWLLILATGALGNAINAWGYRGEAHHSIGASTAVFGALGLLVGAELYSRWSSPITRTRWHLVLPLGAGLSLLAYLGVGDKHEHIDYMAHFWGFMVGIGLGICAAAIRLKRHFGSWGQYLAGVMTLALIAVAWMKAIK